MLEAVLQRDRLVVVAGLVAVLAMAWGWLLAGAGMEMGSRFSLLEKTIPLGH